MQRNVYTEFDLEATPLKIKTNSAAGSDEEVEVRFFTSQREDAGGFNFYFKSPAEYLVWKCMRWYNKFPSNLPTTTDKVWKITLTRTLDIRLIIHCNEVEVVNILISDSSCNGIVWKSYWIRDVEKIWFDSADTASDYYGPGN